jgi:hypothetical protein
MDTLARVIKRDAYNRYFQHPELLEPIFQFFLTEPDRSYAMRIVSEKTGVRLKTLYSWRERVQADPDWRPSKDHFASNRRFFSEEIEQHMAQFIQINFISLGRPLDRPLLRPLILTMIQDFVAEGILGDDALNFKCSYHYMSRFLNRVNLSSRKVRAARRPEINDDECAEFMAKMAAVWERYSEDHIVNFDESSWRLVQVGDRTIAERGVEVVHSYVEGDAKACFTFFASCLADGSKLPLILLAKGKTARCHRQFGDHPGYDYRVWNSPTGWCKDYLVIDFLHVLRERFGPDPICLLMDQFTAHQTDSVMRTAMELSIEIVWIPKGATGLYQPLDRRPFGALKSKGRAKWKRYYHENYEVSCTRDVAAQLLLESWDELSESVILSGWDWGDYEPSDSESDDSDDEFELRLDTDCEDLDENEENEDDNDHLE